ncbi:hypothetical protein [Nostoc sp. T09]|nr:hypothetical protein [Nostoc sp. T09]
MPYQFYEYFDDLRDPRLLQEVGDLNTEYEQLSSHHELRTPERMKKGRLG